MQWYPVELHTHTCHSDGDFNIKEIVHTAKRAGYQALAVTDHNTASGTEEFFHEAEKQGILPVYGLEWTTYYGHMVVLGEQGYTDWRGVKPEEIDDAIRSIHQNGGIVGIAHPFSLSDPINTGYLWEFHIHDWTLPDYIEVWSRNYAPRRIQSERAFALWDELLGKGIHITAMTGRDWHRDDQLPCCYTWAGISGELTAETLLEAVRSGRICLSAGPLLTLKAHQKENELFPGGTAEEGKIKLEIILKEDVFSDSREKDQITAEEIRIFANGQETVRIPVQEQTVLELQAEKGWMRAELYGTYYGTKHCRIAVTNPIYINE